MEVRSRKTHMLRKMYAQAGLGNAELRWCRVNHATLTDEDPQ